MRTIFTLAAAALIASSAEAQLAPPTSPTWVMARSSDAFVESIGVNGLGGPYVTPLPPDGKPYDLQQAKLYNATPVDPHYLMGVRYHRIEGGRFDPKPIIRLYDDYGIRINCLVPWFYRDLSEPANLAKVMKMLHAYPPDMIDSIEGNNEANFWRMSGMLDWVATVYRARVNQDAFYPAVKADPMLRRIPVLCFCIIPVNIGQHSEKLYAGEKTGAFDFEVEHSYEFDTGAGNVELGRTASGVINACGPIADSVVPPGQPLRPIISTETGCTSDHPVAEGTQTRMDPIILASNFAMGVPRTYLYGSWGNKPWDICYHPAGNAIAAMTAMFGEATWDRAQRRWSYPDFQPGALRYHIDPLPATRPGGPISVHQLLLQKSDGTFQLLLWNDVAIWNYDKKPNELYNFPPILVKLTIDPASPIATAVRHDLQTDGSFSATPMPLPGGGPQQLAVDVSDRLTVLELKPRQSQAQTGLAASIFNQVAASKQVDDSAMNAQGLTSACIEGLPPVKTFLVRLSCNAKVPTGAAPRLLIQGTPIQRPAGADVEPAMQSAFANSDWRGRLYVQIMADPGSQRQLEKVEVLAPAQ